MTFRHSTSTSFFAQRALLPDGWANAVQICVDRGQITRIATDQTATGCVVLAGPVLPGMANLHSHAFQRAMAGLAEVSLKATDSFWSWRELMYGLVAKLTPEQLGCIATQVYIEMLKAGYTQVAEFHYLHHDRDGQRYAQPTTMAQQVMAAAQRTGIGITLLPALYSYAGFGGLLAKSSQARFINNSSQYIDLWQQLQLQITDRLRQNIGICLHSLRAVTEQQIAEVLTTLPADLPIHIHIAEQVAEVEQSVDWSGQRPVAWLAERVALDQRWCLVHATHLDQVEVDLLAASGAVVGLCPSTEANLGDGIFPATDYIAAGGRFGIGSDSHVSLSMSDELKLLEYGQRLRDRQRNRLYSNGQKHIGEFLYQQSLQGGAQACGLVCGLQVGARADFITLDIGHPLLATAQPEQLINRWVFALNNSPVADVYVAGQQVIEQGQHVLEGEAAERFSATLRQLL